MPLAARRSRPKTGPGAGPTTLLDVAREAGVSASTVSRILNGTARVAGEKRAAVEAAISKLAFLPNHAARSLKMGTSMTVGVLTQDIEGPFFTRAMRGIEEGLAGSGYAPIIVSGHWNAAMEAERVRLLMARRIDGLVILTGHLSNAQITEFAQHQPIVVTGRHLEGDKLRSTTLDQRQAGYLATRHLLSLGHRRIAHISGPPGRADTVDRQAGYEQALAEYGVALDLKLVAEGDFHETTGLIAMNRLLDSSSNFSAVFAANDQTAYGARMAMYRRGIRVPDDLSIVGIDDLPGSAFYAPPLTTVRQPIYEIGLFAAGALLQLMGHAVTPTVVPPLELVVRETTRRM